MLGTDRTPGEAAGSRPVEGQLLLTAVTQKLRERCGFIPGYDHRPVQLAITADRLPLLSERAVQDFRLIYAGIYRDLLPEWLMAVIEAKRRIWDEFLPHLLMLGQKREYFRQYIIPVLGEAGFWLASEITNQNWKWALELPEMDIGYLRYGEQSRERGFIKQFNGEAFSRSHPAITDLYLYHQVWTEALMTAFLNSLEKFEWKNVWMRSPVYPLVVNFSFYYPLQMRSEILQRLARMDGGLQTNIADHVQVILDFREAMIKGITDA